MRRPPAQRLGSVVIGFALGVCSLLALAAPSAADLVVRGDPHWIEHPDCPEGWERWDADESDWRRIRFPWMHIWPVAWALDPEARPFWGRDIVHRTCVRRSFHLEAVPPSPAEARVWADDDYRFFLNGVLVGASEDFTAELPGETYDIQRLLRPGRNVVALELRDYGGAMGALFSLQVTGGQPEPRGWVDGLLSIAAWLRLALLGGLLAVVAWEVRRWQRRYARAALRRSTEVLAFRAALAAAVTQALLSSVELYSGQRDIPVLDWHLLPAAVVLAAAAALCVVAGPLARLPADAVDRRYHGWLFAGVLLLGLGLRTLWIDSIPVGFFQDEATNGNDALTLGRLDRWQLWSDSVGGRPTLFLYLLDLIFRVFGVSYASLKIAPVAIGTATIAAVYAFGRVAFGPRTALWAAFLFAVARWHIHYSRMAWEAICLPLFAVAGFALLLYGLKRQSRGGAAIIAAAAVLSLGLYTYAAYRAVPAVVVVFLVATILSPQAALLRRRWAALLGGAVVAGLIATPLLRFAVLHPHLYWERYADVSLTSYMAYYATPLPWIEQIARSFLALNNVGDEIVRHNLPDAAHLDPITGALFLLGLALALWRWRHLGDRFLLVWFFVFLALAALTRDGPHATRLLGLAPVCALLAARALDALANATSPRLGVVRQRILAALLASAILAVNAYQYFVVAAAHPWADAEFNATGRSVCEYLRRQSDVDVYWSDDMGFWADGQCFFLARGRYTDPRPIRIDDVLDAGPWLERERETIVVLGREFFDIHRERLLVEFGEPLETRLPGRIVDDHDRQGQLLYRLYHFGPGGSDPGGGNMS